MATKKDLVEAYSFSRRRLVTAFVSGAPGGREVEPTRPGRSVVGGLALAVLLLAGAAIAGVFSTNVDPAWAEQPGLIVSEEEAAVYVITESSSSPVLHPVLNITSAKLILGSDEEPQVIPDEYIDRERVGSDVGIFGAPSDVPDVERLIPDGWTACAAGNRLRLDVTESRRVTPAVADGALLVQVGSRHYIVAVGRPDDQGRTSAWSYPVPAAEQRETLLRGLGFEPFDAKPVSQQWLDLLPTGGPLDRTAFGLDLDAEPLAVPEADRPVPVGAVANAPDGTSFLATQDGLQVLDTFASTVYLESGEQPPVVELRDAPADTAGRPGYYDANWPGAAPLEGVFGEGCVRLLADSGQAPRVEIAQDPVEGAAAAGSAGDPVLVDEGRGAYVLSGGWEDAESGQPFVIDAKGFAYPLGGLADAEQLGYGDYRAPVVPDPWVEIFNAGVELSTNAALCEPQLGEEPCA